jgi:signal transduction histidine kinase
VARTFLIRTGRPAVAPEVVEDRRRTAADLRAGAVPALAHLVELAGDDPALRAAAERAQEELDAVTDWLASPSDEPLDEAIARAAVRAADAIDVGIETDLTMDLQVDDRTQRALVRIVREAVRNAGVHGDAHTVTVSLTGPRPIVLKIVDDGAGFHPELVDRPGGGLDMIRRRAEGLGGTTTVRSDPGSGTTVTAYIP